MTDNNHEQRLVDLEKKLDLLRNEVQMMEETDNFERASECMDELDYICDEIENIKCEVEVEDFLQNGPGKGSEYDR